MSSNTKIVVLRSKELVYALVLFVVSILIILVAVSLFWPSDSNTPSTPAAPTSQSVESGAAGEDSMESTNSASTVEDIYVPGIYSSILQLGSSNVELQITVDKNHINSISFTNVDETVATMYPLMAPTLSEISEQIIAEQSLENISYADENRYTSLLLMKAISDSLDKAKVSENADSPSEALSSERMQ